MSEHLLMDPNELYKCYTYSNVKDYYHYTFLASFTSIETDIFYDILNSLCMKQLSNLNKYIFRQWSLTSKILRLENMTPRSRSKKLLSRSYSNSIISSKDEFNHKLESFIKSDQVTSLYIMNQLLGFLYPCK